MRSSRGSPVERVRKAARTRYRDAVDTRNVRLSSPIVRGAEAAVGSDIVISRFRSVNCSRGHYAPSGVTVGWHATTGGVEVVLGVVGVGGATETKDEHIERAGGSTELADNRGVALGYARTIDPDDLLNRVLKARLRV